MALPETADSLVVGLLVWIGTFFPMRRVVGEVIDSRPAFLAAGISAMLGATALMAWDQAPWYRYTVVTICLMFVGLYVAVKILETFTASGS